MAKPLTAEQIESFRAVCREAADDDGYLTIESFPEDLSGESFEFHAANYDPPETHDYYALFNAVSDEFTVEEEGHGSFYVTDINASPRDEDEEDDE